MGASPKLTWVDRVRTIATSDLGILVLIAIAKVALHTLVNNHYGFHRDELLTFNNARHLDWGYVVYPPVTAFFGRVSLELFGTSLRGFRFFGAVAEASAVLLAGLAARELGGKRQAQVVAAVSVAIGGTCFVHGSFLSYTSFDFPCWILVAYCVIRLLKSEDPRWWLAVGASIALGMMSKYSMAFLAIGVIGGMLFTQARSHLKTKWFWCGIAVCLLIMLPNIIWQMQHDFVSLDYLKSIHARDVAAGRTDYFLLNQLWKNANPVTLPIWLAGLWFVFAVPEGKRYRMLGWMYVIPLLVFFAAKGRDYYLAPAYPMLQATGAVWGQRWAKSLSVAAATTVKHTVCWSLACAGLCTAILTLPIAPLGSPWWHVANNTSTVFDSQVGWPDMVEQVANVRDSLPLKERGRVGILAGDEGEAGAVNLYGPRYGLPPAISGMNSNWYRGYGNPPPETIIVLGEKREFVDWAFRSCESAGHASNRYGIANSSVAGYDEIFVCRGLREPWPEFWKKFRYYG
jgi:4-amino-4-deoxy-L-arabinose transferase-like glycosyltransferase